MSISVSTEGVGMVMGGERGTTSGTDTSEDGSVNEVSVGSALLIRILIVRVGLFVRRVVLGS